MAAESKLERDFQSKLIKELKETYPGCIVSKMNNPQGIPDILILYNDRWALLEAKRSKNAAHQPNQDYYVNKANQMSFSCFVCPENKKEVLDELARTLRPER